MFIVLATAASKQPKRCDKRFCMNIFRYIHTSRLCTVAGSYLVSAMDVWCFSCACSSSVRIIFLSFCQSVQLSFTLTVLQRIRIPQVTSTTAPTTESKHRNKKYRMWIIPGKKLHRSVQFFLSVVSLPGNHGVKENLCLMWSLAAAASDWELQPSSHWITATHTLRFTIMKLACIPQPASGLIVPPPRASHPK